MDGDRCHVQNNEGSKLMLSEATGGYSRRHRIISLGWRYLQAADKIKDHLIPGPEKDHNEQETVHDALQSKES